MSRSFLVALAFTPGSAAALRCGLRIASTLSADVNVVHIIDTLGAVEIGEVHSKPQKAIAEELISDARRAWSEFAADVAGAGELRADVAIDNRVQRILAKCQKRAARLFVIGAYGNRQANVGAGTVAIACVRHSPCGVSLVRDIQLGRFQRIDAAIDFSEAAGPVLARAHPGWIMDYADEVGSDLVVSVRAGGATCATRCWAALPRRPFVIQHALCWQCDVVLRRSAIEMRAGLVQRSRRGLNWDCAAMTLARPRQ